MRLIVAIGVAAVLCASAFANSTLAVNSSETSEEPHHDENHEAHEAAEARETLATVNALKGASLAMMAIVAITVWVGIFCCQRFRHKLPPVLETIGISFSAGVFVYIGIAHLLAEGTEILMPVTEERYRASFACCALMYFVTLLLQRGFGLGDGHSHGHSHDEVGDNVDTAADSPSSVGTATQPEFQGVPPSSATPAVSMEAPPRVAGDENVSTTAEHEHKAESTDASATSTDNVGSVALTLAAFALHSFAEGFGLGLQRTVPGVIMMMIAIMSHQWAEVVTFTTFATKKIPNATIVRAVLMGAQALICPIGVSVAWGISVTLDTHVVIGYALSLASGTFLCVGMTELIPELMNPKQTNLVSFFSCVLGAGTILLIQIFTFNPEAHHH